MDKKLFTPGPLTTSETVKQAMLHDYGSRDFVFVETVREIREELLKVGGVSRESGWEAVVVQGSGTFGVESVIGSVTPRNGKLLIVVNGAYGERMSKMAEALGIDFQTVASNEDVFPDIESIEQAIQSCQPSVLAAVHSETTTGIFNPIEEWGRLAAKYNLVYIVDAMSSFGAVPIDLEAGKVDFLVSSSNKCIEGVPGFSFVLARKAELVKAKGGARSLSLDLFAQWEGLEKSGQFRFTPPTHVLMAFRQALRELNAEGGTTARAARYRENYAVLLAGMEKLGFKPYLSPAHRGYIITSFLYPEHPAFDFEIFYRKLNERGFVIYPGKLSKANCFRIGNIGQLFKEDMQALIAAIEVVLSEMRLPVPVSGYTISLP